MASVDFAASFRRLPRLAVKSSLNVQTLQLMYIVIMSLQVDGEVRELKRAVVTELV